ncbi:hypothetical protein EHS25_006862 [Saitozyma podzolica]|uniref:VASt domain-containing protein n=1 Tax=Saitozyma podzolica TaxID=1890683 RepID=A0A427XRR5_9TREE|nr:hypothetical protein EHS25_006862 [Saitozyma podzolica]
MPSILARFKRSPSASSDLSQPDADRSRSGSTSSNAISLNSERDATDPSTQHTSRQGSESIFVENFDNDASSSAAPSRQVSPTKLTPHRPAPLDVPRPILGTPKLVLTEEGSNSPRSFSSSPVINGSPSKLKAREGLGLGLTPATLSDHSSGTDDLETPRNIDFVTMNSPTDALSVASAPMARTRSESNGSAQEVKKSRRGSILSKVVKNGHGSPNLSPESLQPDSHKSKKDKKRRTKSTSSAGGNSIAAALAKGGLQLAGHAVDDTVSTKRPTNRSPYLVRGDAESSLKGGEGDDELSRQESRLEYDSEEEESDSDLDDHLPVTGFAVASNRRNADFHALFPAVDPGTISLMDILVQGRLYVSENHICFHANIFGWVTDLVIPFTDVRLIEKKMTALVIPNAIGVVTGKEKYTFASFISRDTTYDVLVNIWRLCNPNAVMSTASLVNHSRPASIVEEAKADKEEQPSNGKGHARTQCTCGKENKHYTEIALDTTFPSTPEKVYNLMFNSGWFKTFLTDDQKLKDLESSDWRPVTEGSNLLMRSTSYIKPLNGSIGPKQTKCHMTDEHEHFDLDNYLSMITTTKTPDVPSGGVFSVKTRTCLMWAGANSTRVIVTTTVEWTGKSWVKGIIEKSAIDGQKQYHEDLESGMRTYIKEHATEFASPDGVEDEAPAEETKQEQPPTEAQAYADQARRERHERDFTYMQGALDSVSTGVGFIFSGLKALFEALRDVLSDSPMSKESIMGTVILVLLLSNLYTYYAYSGTTRMGKRSRLARLSEDDEVAEAMRLLLQNAARPQESIREEAAELERILDQIEQRTTRLKGMLQSAVTAEV